MTTTLTHCVLVRNNATTKIVEVVHADDSAAASSIYDDMVASATVDDVHGVTYELRDRFGIRAARLFK